MNRKTKKVFERTLPILFTTATATALVLQLAVYSGGEEAAQAADQRLVLTTEAIQEQPSPEPQPAPLPEPTPEPMPEPTPEPMPEPTPEPTPEPPLELTVEEVDVPCDNVYVTCTLTDLEDYAATYDLLKRVIIQEAGNQGYDGIRAVAQVIYDRAYRSCRYWRQDEGLYGVITQPNQFAPAYKYDIDAYEPTVSEAMEAVFIRGELVFDEITTYFYNEAGSSEEGIAFMHSLKYVGTIGAHEFRTGWDENG